MFAKFLNLSFASLFFIVSAVYISPVGAAEQQALSVSEKDITNVHVNSDGSSVEISEQQTLIRSQLAVDNHSQVDIPYLSNFQDVKIVEAYTITPGGVKIPVGAAAVRTVDGDNSDGKSLFSDMKHRIIVFPNVGPGAHTYYKVIITTTVPLFPGHYFERYSFGSGTEWAHSEVNLSHDPKINIKVDPRDVSGGRIENGPAGEIRYRFFYKNSGISVSEPNQISESDLSPHVYISSFRDQLDMADAYEARARDKYKVTPSVQKLADQITKGISDPKMQAEVLYYWVSKEIRYVAIYLGAGGVVPHYADEIIVNRYGDCKDKTTLLIALLNAKGIPASAAEINSSNSYDLPKLAVLGPFNHLITYLPTWDMYLDPTAERAPFGVLPMTELDKPTILTALGAIGRTPKQIASQNSVYTIAKVRIHEDGSITGSSNTLYSGTEDIGARYVFEGADSAYEESIVRDNLIKARLTGTGNYRPSNAEELSKPFELDTVFSLDPITNFPGPGAISMPIGLAPAEFLKIAYSKPPAKATKPVVCRSRSITEVQEIDFPNSDKVTGIPNGVTYNEDGINFSSSYQQIGNHVTVNRELVVQHPSMVCQPVEVREWSKFVNVLQKDLREQIFYQ